jgi:hypothetical protein
LERDQAGKVVAPAGELSCAGTVRTAGKTGRYDRFVPPGRFTLIVQDDLGLSATARQICEDHAISVVIIADRRSATDAQIGDTQGQFGRFMASHGIKAMLVRPDFYLFGGAQNSGRLDHLLQDYARQQTALLVKA